MLAAATFAAATLAWAPLPAAELAFSNAIEFLDVPR
jgi:hypothetical protein